MERVQCRVRHGALKQKSVKKVSLGLRYCYFLSLGGRTVNEHQSVISITKPVSVLSSVLNKNYFDFIY